jgi:transposase
LQLPVTSAQIVDGDSPRAVGQVEQGAHPDEVAQVPGMIRTAVYAWLARYREGGGRRSGSPLPGRPPRLSGAQLARLYGLVVVPRQLRFASALWTRAIVRERIGREFGGRRSRSASAGCCASSAYRRLRLWFLAGYSPELNPGEWLWKHVKHDQSTCLHSPWVSRLWLPSWLM